MSAERLKLRQEIRRRKRHRRCASVIYAVLCFAVFIGIFYAGSACRANTDKVYITYTVSQGDTLWSIAREVYGDKCDIRYMIDDIQRDNGISGCRIYPGMELYLPIK